MTIPEKRALWPHVITAVITVLIQLLAAAYVYGQMSTMVSIHTEEIRMLQQTKLDSAIYFRENPARDPSDRWTQGGEPRSTQGR